MQVSGWMFFFRYFFFHQNAQVCQGVCPLSPFQPCDKGALSCLWTLFKTSKNLSRQILVHSYHKCPKLNWRVLSRNLWFILPSPLFTAISKTLFFDETYSYFYHREQARTLNIRCIFKKGSSYIWGYKHTRFSFLKEFL